MELLSLEPFQACSKWQWLMRGFFSFTSMVDSGSDSKHFYCKVTNPPLSPSHLQELPGFTRSVYKRDHALITPESHVFRPLPEWTMTSGVYLITPAIGSHFVMYLAKMQDNSLSGLPPNSVARFIFVVQGAVTLTNVSGISHKLTEVHYNQHGLLLLEEQGIYRLGDSWHPVQAGDVVWMVPFVPQWYAALGKSRTRDLLYKDVNRNPL